MAELGETTDPTALVPGSPAALAATSTQWTARADAAEAAATRLLPLRTVTGWRGDAADKYAAKAGRVARDWQDHAELLGAGVLVLDGYAGALATAQSRAADAIEKWEKAKALSARAAAAAPDGSSTTAGDDDPGAGLRGEAVLILHQARAVLAAAGDQAAAALDRLRSGKTVTTAEWAALGLSAATPAAALALLKTLSPEELLGLAADPGLAKQLAKADSTAVASWWHDELTSAQHAALIQAIPAVIGNLGGVAYRDRDQANRIVLADAIAAAKRDHGDPDQLLALEAISNASVGHTLASVVLDHPPLAQVAVGDLDTATGVTFIVPGMGTTVQQNMGDYVSAAANLQAEQHTVSGVPAADLAVVAWLGYHPPMNSNVSDVWFNDKAEAGAPALANDLTAMHAVHQASGAPTSISVVAHSYGTDVAALALTTAHADHAVLLGSAGVDNDVQTASELEVPKGQVFASQGVHDGWAPLGQALAGSLGQPRIDPTTPSFGAHDFSSEASTVDGATLHAIDHHGPFGDDRTSFSYLDNNTTAQYNTALATTGQGAGIPVGDTPDDRAGMFLSNAVKAAAR